MSKRNMPFGVWPVMLTPFTSYKQIDWESVDRLTDWYIASGAAGLFAVSGSSEMYELSNEERLSLARRVVSRSAGKVPVIAAGTFGRTLEDKIELTKQMSQTGVEAVVCIVSQLAQENQPDGEWRDNVEKFLEKTDNIALGLYECPVPYHRVLTPEQIEWLGSTDRFLILKETSENINLIKEKIVRTKGSNLQVYNACAATLLESLRAGGQGYSGIAGNLYPELFVWLCRYFQEQPDKAERLSQFITSSEDIVGHKYPACAKAFLNLLGLPFTTTCRVCDHSINGGEMETLQALRQEVENWHKDLGI